MASNEQIPVNQTAAVIEAEEARIEAGKENEAEQAEKKRADLESKLKTGDALVTALKAHMAKPTPQTPTGFPVIDKALGDGVDAGGLPPGLITLGAIPSLGKTAIVLQMADNIAEQDERDVLTIALEMSALELTARSVSRLTAATLTRADLMQDPRSLLALTARGVRLFNARRGMYTNQAQAEYWREMDERLSRALKRYGEKIAPRISIHEPASPIRASEIRSLVDLYAEIRGKAPVIVLDYIQILAAENGKEHNTEKANMDEAALKLKHISRDYETPVLCISSFNRMNYAEPVSMESFKESGGIEYSSDVVIGLQLYGTGWYTKKGETLDVDYEKSRTPRRIQARILKNRDGITGQFVNLEYFPAVNLFQEVSEKPARDFHDVPATWKADVPRPRETAKPNNSRGTNTDTDPVDMDGEIEAPAKPRKKASERPRNTAI